MRIRFAPLLGMVSVVALIAWLSLAGPGEEGIPPESVEAAPVAEWTGGSRAPCDVPLAWRIARVDAEFGLTTEEAARALAQAMALWEEAAGRPLFALDPEGGSPVRLVYDDRQARSEERRRAEDEVDREGRELDALRAGLEARMAAHERETEDLALLSGELERRIGEHNDVVRLWNERGGAPEDTLAAVSAVGEALERERVRLVERQRELEARAEGVEEERQRFQGRVDEHNARVAELERRFPPTAVESGVYREAVRSGRGGVVSVSREIRVYRFDDRADLVRVLAHELGHALGLEHAAEQGSLMSATYGRGAREPGGALVQQTDVGRLRERCPGLVREP